MLDELLSKGPAWGVAFRDAAGFHTWCYGHGNGGWSRLTKRAAALEALMSNNGRQDGPFVPVPLMGSKNEKIVASKDLGRCPKGPYSPQCLDLYHNAWHILMERPDTDYSELPKLE